MLTHPAASLYPLVDIVRERLTAHVASRSLCGVEISILQYDLSLADDHQGHPAHLGTLEDVVLHCLENKKQWHDTAWWNSVSGSGSEHNTKPYWWFVDIPNVICTNSDPWEIVILHCSKIPSTYWSMIFRWKWRWRWYPMLENIIDPFRKHLNNMLRTRCQNSEQTIFAAHLFRTVVEIQYKENKECWKWEWVNEGGSTVY